MKFPLTHPKTPINPNALPFALGQSLGLPNNAPPKNPYPPLICGAMTAKTAKSTPIHLCQSHTIKGQPTQDLLMVNTSQSHLITACHNMTTIGFKALTACQGLVSKEGVLIYKDTKALTQGFELLKECITPNVSAIVHYANDTAVDFAQTVLYHTCQTPTLAPITLYQSPLEQACASTVLYSHCHSFVVKQGIPVPCLYYPIAPPPKPKPKQSPCGDRPPPNRLPLPLARKGKAFKPYALPLPLACGNPSNAVGNPTPYTIPTQKGYVMHHTISARLDDTPIDPLSFSMKTDMASFCWQGQVEIGIKDFNAIKDKLNRPNGREPVLTVQVNTATFAFICEDITHNQRFASSSISLSGRSLSAHLSKDYAQAQPLDNVDLYASQVVSKQLENLSITAKFAIDDYLIPKGSYTTTGKTPIGVLDDIAKACGGFLYSEPNKPIIHLLPRHKTPAWQAMSADVILAQDVIKTLSTTVIKQPLYNTVTLVGQTQGGIVYRSDMGQDKDAPVSDNLLYTEQTNIVKAGIALLSDSGNKIKLTAVLPFDGLAQLGDVWQVGEPLGVVQSVSVSATVSDGVVSVWQTVTLLGHNDD